MKRFIIVCLGIIFCTVWAVRAQQSGQSVQPATQSQRDWYNCSVDADGVFGAEVNKAYEFLKGKKIRKRPIVAILGGGMDVEHEDLKKAIWTNPKEKPDGRDNDRNGLVDDLNGWNFLGSGDGTEMEMTMREGDREFLRLKDRYADYFTSDGKFYKYIDGATIEVPAPEDTEEYYYFKNVVMPESQIGKMYGGYRMAYMIEEYGRKYDRILKEKYPDQTVTEDMFRNEFFDPAAPVDTLRDVPLTLTLMAFNIMRTNSWDTVYEKFVLTQVDRSRESYQSSLAMLGNDGRKDIVGDDYLDLNDTVYGNNELLASNSFTSVMQAGIIAGVRSNGIGIDGIADARIMSLRVNAGSGEPYLKDIALALRYAVDKGADIIVLPEQNTLYPPGQREWITDALQYAESKGVLVIVPVWELSDDLSMKTYYPNRRMIHGRELTNLMVVASSDRDGNPSMNANYGADELDLFAPGIEIFSSYTGDTYRFGSGTALSAATTAGVAALIKSHYPELTGPQIRKLLIENVTSREGVEVEKGIVIDGKSTQDLFLFEELSISGGIINAYEALKEADRMVKGS